jgi:FKBP-type peptidyl-prolyl cis-trans isomerase SlyD
MHNMSDKIQNEKAVSLAYTLTVDGEVVEEWTAAEPFEYLHGAENIVPGLEAALDGKTVGDKVEITISPADGYGEYDAEDFEMFDKADLGDEAEIGMAVMLEDEEGFLFEGLITEVNGDQVKVDFNHEMAGKTLSYVVEVVSIRDADADELEHGHVHGDEDDIDWDDEDDEDEE